MYIAALSLVFLAPPTIQFINSTNGTLESMDVVLRCEVLGYPLSSVTWVSDAHANHSNEYLNYHTDSYEVEEEYIVVSILLLENVTIDFRGNYTCHAKNSLGEADDDIHISVYGENTALPVFLIRELEEPQQIKWLRTCKC